MLIFNPHYAAVVERAAFIRLNNYRYEGPQMANDAHSEKSVTMTDNASGKKVTFSVSSGTLGPMLLIFEIYMVKPVCLPLTLDMVQLVHVSLVLLLLMVIRVCYTSRVRN